MLRLGERIGDVKTERWKMRAQSVIDALPTVVFGEEGLELGEDTVVRARGERAHRHPNSPVNLLFPADDNDSAAKCLVCQCEYEAGEVLRKLPCKHVFHSECCDEWLGRSSACPYCRTCVEEGKVVKADS